MRKWSLEHERAKESKREAPNDLRAVPGLRSISWVSYEGTRKSMVSLKILR